jgi:hypothetical protein
MDEILWHRRESRRQTEKTYFFLSSGSLLSTHKACLKVRAILRLFDHNVTVKLWHFSSTEIRDFSMNSVILQLVGR